MSYEGEFQIVTRVLLDREKRARYTVQLSCRDGGRPALMTYRQLDIDVADVNDNSPTFERNLYAVDVHENNYVGSVVVQVSGLSTAFYAASVALDTQRMHAVDNERKPLNA